AGLLLLAGWLSGRNIRDGWRILRRDGGKTASPNAGRPMAAMAGLLGVRLAKKGAYVLGDVRNDLGPATVDVCWKIVVLAGLLMVMLMSAAFCFYPQGSEYLI